MTSLINIKSDMRKRINDRLYTSRLCIEHLGIANPGPSDIRKWKESWDNPYTMAVKNISKARKVLKEQEVPPLLYDIRYNNWDWHGEPDDWAGEGSHRIIYFYNEEDLIIFKMMYDNS